MATKRRFNSSFGDQVQPNTLSEVRKNIKRSRFSTFRKIFLIVLLMSLLSIVHLRTGSVQEIKSDFESDATTSSIATALVAQKSEEDIKISKNWSYCNDHPPQPNSPTQTNDSRIDPLWLPTYPTSLPGAYPTFLSALTGIASPAKNYYRSSKMLKRCHSTHPNDIDKIFGVTCETVHPIVPSDPTKIPQSYGASVLLAIRNPLTAFPAFHQDKAEKYHGAQGQVEKEEWIKFRDEFVGTTSDSVLFTQWKDFINEWRNMESYHIAAYLPYEYWSDKEKGPNLAISLTQVLKKEGFPVLYDEEKDGSVSNLDCLWYEQIYDAVIAADKKLVDEGWYVPDYTSDQLRMLSSEMQKFVQEIKEETNAEEKATDEQLIALLNSYTNTVQKLLQ